MILNFAERRHHPATAHSALIAASLIVINLGVFFTWIFPANQVTEYWSTQPYNWEALRPNWEYGHAANAVLVGLAFIALIMARVRRETT